jgi:hypothetical protein
MVAVSEGIFPYFHEAFTQLHLGQLLASIKCVSRDRRDGGIDPNADHILRNHSSSLPRVNEDLGHGQESKRVIGEFGMYLSSM